MNNEEVKENKEENIADEIGNESNPEKEEIPDEATEKATKKEVKNKLKEENVKLKAEIEQLKNDLLRNRADLENFKKHIKEEQIRDRKYASTNLVTEIVTPLEYLTKACEYQSESAEMNNFLVGFKMIAKQLMDVLVNDGLSEIITNVGDEFDPTVHHAMSTEKTDEYEANKVIEVLSKGYKYKDRIIKPVMVKVSE